MKTTREVNWRVEVTPDARYEFWHRDETPEETAKRKKNDCEHIADDIRRHVDDYGTVAVECDTVHVCSLCGCEWDEILYDTRDPQYPVGMPMCCDAAIKEWEEAQSET